MLDCISNRERVLCVVCVCTFAHGHAKRHACPCVFDGLAAVCVFLASVAVSVFLVVVVDAENDADVSRAWVLVQVRLG